MSASPDENGKRKQKEKTFLLPQFNHLSTFIYSKASLLIKFHTRNENILNTRKTVILMMLASSLLQTATQILPSSDGLYIVSTSFENLVRIYSTVSGKLLHSINCSVIGFFSLGSCHAALPYHTLPSADSSPKSFGVRIVKLPSLFTEEVIIGHTAHVTITAISPSENTIVSGAEDATARVYSLNEKGRWEVVATLTGHNERVDAIAINDKFIATGAADFAILIFDSKKDYQFLHSVKVHESYVIGLSFNSLDGHLASCSTDNSINIWDPSRCMLKGAIENVQGSQHYVSAVTHSPSGRTIATGGTDGIVRIWKTRNLDLLDELNCEKVVGDILSLKASVGFCPL